MSETTATLAAGPSAPECNLLYGVKAIAEWSGMTPAACRARIADGTLPVFRLPNVRVVCALKSTLNGAWAQYEARSWKNTLAP